MSSIDNLAKDLVKIMHKTDEKGPKPYEPIATVVKEDENNGDILWVKIPGSDSDTPVEKTVSASPGDRVRVRVSGGRAWVVGNASNPPTDDTRAIQAQQTAITAHEAADEAWKWADSAHEAADVAWEYADSAHEAADEAWNQAARATGYANDALTQLSTVEDVVDTLNWVTEHGTMTPTTDTEIDPTHVYFVRDAQGDYIVGNYHYRLITDPKESELSTYYVLSIDEAVSNYVASHLALTNEGLYVVKDNQGYKVLLSNTGLSIQDNGGHTVATFGENIIFDAERPQSIGGENAYILFHDSDNDRVPDKITIGGNVSMVGSSKTLSETLNEIGATAYGALTYDHEYTLSADGTVATFVAHVYRGGQDVTSQFNDEDFTWYYKTDATNDRLPINRSSSGNNKGKTMTVLLSDMKYGGEVIGVFSPSATSQQLLRSNGDGLTDVENRALLSRAIESGSSIRVRDLTYTTSVLSSDAIMVVTPETEELATIGTLINSMQSNSTPLMDGTASTGYEKRFSSGDHVHPTDTTRAPIVSPAFSGSPSAPTPINSTNSTRLATTAFVHNVIGDIAFPQSDWNETDSSDYSYIQNKPTRLSSFSNDLNLVSHLSQLGCGYLEAEDDSAGTHNEGKSFTAYMPSSQLYPYYIDNGSMIAVKFPTNVVRGSEAGTAIAPKIRICTRREPPNYYTSYYPIYYNGEMIPSDQIKANEIAFLVYDANNNCFEHVGYTEVDQFSNTKAGIVPRAGNVSEYGEWKLLSNMGWLTVGAIPTYDDAYIYWARKYSPEFTGIPTAPTAAHGTNTTQIATTAFVQDAVAGGGGGGSSNVWYATCDTASSENTKVAVTTNGDYQDVVGAVIYVKFTFRSTTIPGYLSVDGITHALYRSSNVPLDQREWGDGAVVPFVFDGTNFIRPNLPMATTSQWGATQLRSTISSTTSFAATPAAVKIAYDLADSKQDALVSGENIKTINGSSLLGSGNLVISGGGGTSNIPYCLCETRYSVADKVATIVSGSLDSLTVGTQVLVKFSFYNSAYNPTLKIGDTEAIPIVRYGAISPGSTTSTSWFSGAVITFTYDGTYWIMTDYSNDTTYEIMTASEIISPSWVVRTIRPVLLKYAIQYYSWPVGSTINTVSKKSPDSRLGGTWNLIGMTPEVSFIIATDNDDYIALDNGDYISSNSGVSLYVWEKVADPSEPIM